VVHGVFPAAAAAKFFCRVDLPVRAAPEPGEAARAPRRCALQCGKRRVVTHCRKVHFIGTSALSMIFHSKFCQAESLRRSIGVAKAQGMR
jgi:hypothetical protein